MPSRQPERILIISLVLTAIVLAIAIIYNRPLKFRATRTGVELETKSCCDR
jgi:cell division protein FtsL